ncbi:MAG: hypothetical protein Ct9H90mP20_3970 [Candidatus Neomarinimicrobiota bacterium]|nr:MAG: hypothetical protein Ct9H90mP20_3970 [Candidatus Neomarinimicrobiota bacterium]
MHKASSKEKWNKNKKAVVTGATGGVGCLAVKLLSKLEADVTAVTSKKNSSTFLRPLGPILLSPLMSERTMSTATIKRPFRYRGDVVGGEVFRFTYMLKTRR